MAIFRALCLTVLTLAFAACIVLAQGTDSLPAYSLQTVVVTADRTENPIANTTSSVSSISGSELQELPIEKVSDAARYLPGLFMADKNGTGRDPIISSRGFYGGGEAEYLLVLVDGRPINDIETGLVNWNLVPSSGIGSLELVRGSSSPLYGDIALGGVMNIITRQNWMNHGSVSLAGGSYGGVNGSGSLSGALGSANYRISASNERTNGFRDHGDWRGTTLQGSMEAPVSPSTRIRFNLNGSWNNLADPGPLTDGEWSSDPRQSSVYYRADGRRESRQSASVELRTMFGETMSLSASMFGNLRQLNAVRTLTTPAIVYPTFAFRFDTTLFGDTKERELRSTEAGANLQVTLGGRQSAARMIAGLDGSYGKLNSKYYAMMGGFQEEFASQAPSRGSLLNDGDAARSKFAVYSGLDFHPAARLTISFGGRYDFLRDSYTGATPETLMYTNHSDVSVKYGLNYNYMAGPSSNGNFYANFNKSFKAPTLDQLTDQRPIDAAFFGEDAGGYTRLPFPPFAPYSNISLTPQRALNYEVGAYQSVGVSDGLSLEQTLSAYQMDVKDEIDFDLQTFSYRNIQQSRHLGMESGTRLRWSSGLSAFINYTWTSVRFTAGPTDGNFLKAIPRNTGTAGVAYSQPRGFGASVDWTFSSGIWLDDGNTSQLDGFNYGNIRLSYKLSGYRFFADVHNVLNTVYRSTGYLLYGTAMYLPSAGRIIQGGLTADF